MRIVPLAPEHAADAARLHIAGQPGTFLTSLGPGVLTPLYRALPASTAGFGFAALDTGPQDPPQSREGPVLAGFVSATTGVARLFADVGLRLVPPVLAQLARHPLLVGRTLQTALYPLTVRGEGGPPAAELLSIMVEPACRSQGVGAQLLAALVDACRARGLVLLDVTVDAANTGAQRFYARHGFAAHRHFTLYGREMVQIRLDLDRPFPTD